MPEPVARIHRLPEGLINSIAAGEVIERPASVVKELIENSLDAGARTVRVRLEGDGTRLIRVHDDGAGMSRADVCMAVERHATSKIAELADLAAITTLGFRGEALASIGAVSTLTITSALAAAPCGWRIEVRNGKAAPAAEPVSHPAGTTIEVRDLFAAVPARRKFLRSARTELHHVQEVVRRLALARPELGFQLSADDRQLVSVRAAPADALGPQRLGQIVGREFAGVAVAVAAAVDGLEVSGWVAPAAAARNQNDIQYLVLNSRPIRDVILQRAIRRAYDSTLPEGRYPAYVLALRLPYDYYDANVHPAKVEVRFRDPREIHDFLYKAVRDALAHPTRVTASGAAAAQRPAATGASSVGLETWRVYRNDRGCAPLVREPAGGEDAATPGAQVLGVIDHRFLLCRAGDEFQLVDARTACAETTLARLADASPGRSRPLLVPARAVCVDAPGWLQQHGAMLAALGFECDALGPREVALRQVPTVLDLLDGRAVLEALLGLLEPAVSTPDRRQVLETIARAIGADLNLGSGVQAWLQCCERDWAAGYGSPGRVRRSLDAATCEALLARGDDAAS